ncbi:MAG TPA: DNA translocase FtsK 4TM domain-containing protein [Acidimicrobiales bacterium]|nr:DNA translocase FtsK 4TM domain-containing protein [Acidimicrobiales bacterium]
MAIGLVTVAVLLGLALYGGAAGFVGSGVNKGLGLVIGWTRYLVPPACVLAGVLIVAGRTRPHRWRIVAGGVLGLLSVAGLADLSGGSPAAGASGAVLRGAGGILGAVIGRPLQQGVGTAGTVVLLVAAFAVGLVLSTGASISGLAQGIGVVGSYLGRSATGLAGVGRRRADPDAEVQMIVPSALEPLTAGWAAPEEVPEDQVDDEPIEEVPEPPRARRSPSPSGPTRGPAGGDWQLPPLRLLKRSREQQQDERQLEVAGAALVAALGAHGVETRLVGRTVGPTVTRFELELGPGVKVARVTSLSRDIAYAMASPDVRILAPIPGKSAIGVEVPNRNRQLVSLGDVLSSPEGAAADHPMEVGFGRDIAGRSVMVNLTEMPHLLISGATGAGKSSCINSLITSILVRSTPDQVRMILVDPKRVELGHYNGLPHLLSQVVVDPKKAANALAWAVKEMERRYDVLAEHGMRDITGYNEALASGDLGGPTPSIRARVAEAAARARARGGVHGEDDEVFDGELDEDEPPESGPERLPFVLIVVDELNDLMMVAARDVEDSVVRLAQMARAVGIHLVLATQRPSVDVITGVIKANIPSRMAFSVSSLADSRVILDQQGAERLIGKGDMLLLTASSNVPRRLQAPWVSEDEVRQVVAHWRRQGGMPELVVGIDDSAGPTRGVGGDDDDDELLAVAMELVVRSQLGSTSMLQRKLRVGFARAGRLMDLLERRGIVGPSEGSKARAVLMSPDELDGGLR